MPAVAHGAFAGLLGRDHPRGHRPAEGWGRDPGDRLEALGGTSATALLDAAAERLGRPCVREERSGRVEREVVAAAEGAGLLVLARDGGPVPAGAEEPRTGRPVRRRPRAPARCCWCGRNGHRTWGRCRPPPPHRP
ncbi:hypothetical protein GCM10017687_37130 [Streptomyces echinatus]|uniref:universal stress protein n=1 Tax=Streptomyces echinatus TaxID=67293 RepID=UPI00337D96A3